MVSRGRRATGWRFYRNNFGGTVEEALHGFLWGNLLALAAGRRWCCWCRSSSGSSPRSRSSATASRWWRSRPILYVVLGGSDGPGDPSPTAVALAAISVFFTTVVGAVLGFRSADRTSLDLVAVYGGGRLAQLRKVQLVAALPAILAALQIAAPAAFLGAILGEYIGGVDRGVGPALINAQQNLDAGAAWGIMIVCGVVAGLGYASSASSARFVTPWAKGAAA